MPRAHGCTGAAMYRMYGMPRVQDDIQGRISVARSRMLGATAQERRCTGCTGRYLLLQYLHFHHPCGRSRERTTTGKWEVRLQEVIGRVESGTETESNVGNSCRGAHERCMYKIELCRERTTTGMWEIEQRREQRSRKTKPGSGDSRILYPG